MRAQIAIQFKAFLITWLFSVVALMVYGLVDEAGREYHSTVPLYIEFFQSAVLLGIGAFVVILPAWLILTTPYYWFCMRKNPEASLWLHAFPAVLIGAIYMLFISQMLSIDGKEFLRTCPIAAVAAFIAVASLRWNHITGHNAEQKVGGSRDDH